MAFPSSMTTPALDHPKGWPGQHVVDLDGHVDPNAGANCKFYAGRCVHVSAYNTLTTPHNGTVNVALFRPGAVDTQMPIFLVSSLNQPSVSNPGDGATDPSGWTAVQPTGKLTSVVGVGGQELMTTEFETSQTYSPNDILHSPDETEATADVSQAGLLYKRKGWTGGGDGVLAVGTDHVCGIVSRGKITNHNRRTMLSFWPWFIPEFS